jgi:hypothetical protein
VVGSLQCFNPRPDIEPIKAHQINVAKIAHRSNYQPIGEPESLTMFVLE